MNKSNTLLKIFFIAIVLFNFGLSNNSNISKNEIFEIKLKIKNELSKIGVKPDLYKIWIQKFNEGKDSEYIPGLPMGGLTMGQLPSEASNYIINIYIDNRYIQERMGRVIKRVIFNISSDIVDWKNINVELIDFKSKEMNRIEALISRQDRDPDNSKENSWDGLNVIANNIHVSAELEKKERELLKLEKKYKNIEKTLSDLQNKYQNLENEKNNDSLKFEEQYQDINKTLSDLQNKYQNLENEKNNLTLNIKEKEEGLNNWEKEIRAKEKKFIERELKSNQEISAIRESLELEKKKLEEQICAEPIIEKNEPDACRCLMEEGDSDFILKNKDACDKIIAREFQVIRNKLISIDIKN